MKLTTKGQYGLLAMYDLAVNSGTPTSVKSISERQGISDAYLEQLMCSLKKANLVTSTRGALGGYQLSKMPEEISIKEILIALEGSVSIIDCLDDPKCLKPNECPSRPLFLIIQNNINSLLSSLNLSDMIK